jgi:lipopolysaccharide transport system permease protein
LGRLPDSRHKLSLFQSVWRHRQLLGELVRREWTDRHAGQMFGALWSLGQPLLLTAVYLFLFVVIMPMRGLEGTSDRVPYFVLVLAGLIPWLAAQDSFMRGTSAITANANLVKQVIFPIELLPLKGTLAALLPPAIMTLGLIITVFVLGVQSWTLIFVPVLWLVQIIGMAGASFGLAAIGAYVKDAREVVQLFGLVNLYLMPVFYPVEMVPMPFRVLIYANPFSYGAWCYQDAWSGQIAHPLAWVLFPTFAGLALFLGWRTFRAAKPLFGNVL